MGSVRKIGLDIILAEQYVRLYGINAWEIRGEEKEKGVAAKEYLEKRLKDAAVEIETREEWSKRGKDKYGRWLGIVYANRVNINEELVEKGYARKYPKKEEKMKDILSLTKRKTGKVSLFLILAVLLISAVSFAQEKYDFRRVKWGMSKEEVKQSEGKEPVFEKEDGLGYKEELGGLDVVLFYYFRDNRLYQAAYSDMEKHTFRNKYIDDYKKFKELLIRKYGDPILDKQIWYDDLYKNDPSEWGLAISIGHMKYMTAWQNDETTITLGLTGDNFKIDLFILYAGEQISKEVEEKKEKEELEKL